MFCVCAKKLENDVNALMLIPAKQVEMVSDLSQGYVSSPAFSRKQLAKFNARRLCMSSSRFLQPFSRLANAFFQQVP